MSEQHPVYEGLLMRYHQVQIHRGPDDGSVFSGLGVGLTHCHLSILGHKLTEWMAGHSYGFKLRGCEVRYLFKKHLEAHLPQKILYQPKMKLDVSLENWFCVPLPGRVKTSLRGTDFLESDILDSSFTQQVINQLHSRRRGFSVAICSLLMFEAFQRKLQAR